MIADLEVRHGLIYASVTEPVGRWDRLGMGHGVFVTFYDKFFADRGISREKFRDMARWAHREIYAGMDHVGGRDFGNSYQVELGLAAMRTGSKFNYRPFANLNDGEIAAAVTIYARQVARVMGQPLPVPPVLTQTRASSALRRIAGAPVRLAKGLVSSLT